MFKIQYPWKYKWKHKNLILIFAATALSVYILNSPYLTQLIEGSNNLGYAGAFIAGFFFSSLFTVPVATVVLALLGKTHDPMLVALAGASGTMAADFIIFRLIRKSIDNLSGQITELKMFIERHNPVHFSGGNNVIRWARMHMLPVFAGLIIASPLPDEIAIGMLSAANYSRNKMLLLSFVSNFAGIFIVAYLGRALF